MSKNEGHPIRNGTIATVMGGLILSFIPYTRKIFVGVLDAIWSWISGVFNHLWQHLTSSVELPWFIVWILLLTSIPTIWRLMVRLLPHTNALQKKDYNSDEFFGIRWKWGYDWGGNPTEISAFCPKCGTRLVYVIDR